MIETGLSVGELEAALRTTDPMAVLVPPRILRRVIRADHPETGVALQVPHRKTYVARGKQLFSIVSAVELGLPRDAPPPEYVILLPRPEAELLARTPRSVSLVKYWRLLFHARVHLALERLSQAGKLTYDAVHARIMRLGTVAFDEARAVMTQEHFLTEQADDRRVYMEFVAIYLEHRYFVPALLPLYFPALPHAAGVEAVLAEDVEAAALLQATRLPGAPDLSVPAADARTTRGGARQASSPARPTRHERGAFRQGAYRAAEYGNDVRAIILRKQVSAGNPASSTASADMDRLARRLQAALDFDDGDVPAWRTMLTALLDPAARDNWHPAARLLYDLQKICLENERPLSALALGDWMLSLGRRPLTRPLPELRFVRARHHLDAALSRLSAAGLADAERRDSAMVLKAAREHAVERIRGRVRPILLASLEEIGPRPANFPERIARDKLIDELLDRLTEVGYLTMSDLRDALSRNQLKLPDLEYLGDLYHGDPLLLWNRRLRDALPGIYHPGEIYLRWLQKVSSLAFGNRVGRFLTRYVALPFGGAFVILEGLQHVVEPIAKRLSVPEAAAHVADLDSVVETAAASHPTEAHVHLLNPISLPLLGVFLLLIMHVPAFRKQVGSVLGGLFRTVRWSLIGLPTLALKLPPIRMILDSRPVRLGWQYLLKPLLFALPFSALFPMFGAQVGAWATGTALLAVAASVLLNSRLGRDLEEVSADWLVLTWDQVRTDILPGIFWVIMHVFKSLVDGIERTLYTVDEWLRFKEGDPRGALAMKAVFGTLWTGIRYVIRFCVNLLIEPQINPIKHFPVVTVSHKLVLALVLPHMITALSYTMDRAQAATLATAICFAIPGIFGFLVWELKENWRLYQANRPDTLTPAVIGHHGETMVRFLRLGFHSGTLPKLFARLRKAHRRALKTNQWKSFRKNRDALHHVEESLHRFIERDFLALLHHSKSWGGAPLSLGKIAPATNVIRLELLGADRAALNISMIERQGRLLARIDAPGWRERLSESQRRALILALEGLFRVSGVKNGNEDVTIDWQQWVDAWERDQAGKEIELPAQCREIKDV